MAYERESHNGLPERPPERKMRYSEHDRAIALSFWYENADVSVPTMQPAAGTATP